MRNNSTGRVQSVQRCPSTLIPPPQESAGLKGQGTNPTAG